MNLPQLQEYCMNKKGVEETMPFDSETSVVRFSRGRNLIWLSSLRRVWGDLLI